MPKESSRKIPLPPDIVASCRSLREKSTNPEERLWSFLRDRRLKNAKFRRQYPVGGYILDFYCHAARLAVELDGSGHLDEAQMEYDAVRTEKLGALGIELLRFWNDAILNDLETVLGVIWEALPDQE
jgi:very-short-patch-repair endonuclease